MLALKKRFGLSYRRIKRVSSIGDSDPNKVLRSLFAQKMLNLYAQDAHVVNIDETWVPCSDFRRRCWGERGSGNSMHDTALSSRVNCIVAVSSEGHVWMALTQCNTDENVFQMFLSYLTKAMTQKLGANWRDDVIFQIDGASYHRSVDTRRYIDHLRIKVVLSAPYSYAVAPAELWFASLKTGDFNPR